MKVNNLNINNVWDYGESMSQDDIVYRLTKRAEIRRSIKDRKSVQEGRPDRISDLLEEAAEEILSLRDQLVVAILTNPEKFPIERGVHE